MAGDGQEANIAAECRCGNESESSVEGAEKSAQGQTRPGEKET